MEKEYKIDIKLPSTLTVHIPAFSEMTIERMFEVMSSDVAKRMVRDAITEAVAKEFMVVNKKSIQKYVEIYVHKNRDEILEAIKDKLL